MVVDDFPTTANYRGQIEDSHVFWRGFNLRTETALWLRPAPQQEPSRLPESPAHANRRTSQTEQKNAYAGHKRQRNTEKLMQTKVKKK